jgi:hypothetical protein
VILRDRGQRETDGRTDGRTGQVTEAFLLGGW